MFTSSQTLSLIVFSALCLGLYANWRLQILLQQQKTFSKIVVDQLKTAHDSIASLERRVAMTVVPEPTPVPEVQPTVVKDSWTFASNWITFVQTSSPEQRHKAAELIQKDNSNEELQIILKADLSPETRLAKALTYSSTALDSTERLVVMHAVKEASKEVKDIPTESKNILTEPEPKNIPIENSKDDVSLPTEEVSLPTKVKEDVPLPTEVTKEESKKKRKTKAASKKDSDSLSFD